MSWAYSFGSAALKELKKLDRQAQKNILAYLDERVTARDDPRDFGKALKGDLAGLWRYRIGDYRLICELRNQEWLILVVTVGHRKNVYD